MTTRILPAGKRRCDASLNAPVGVDFKTGVRSSRVEYKEGIKAKRIVVSSVTPRVKPSTRASGCKSRWMLEGPDATPETMRSRSASAQCAISKPVAAPDTARRRPSVSNCLIRRARPAPMAMRMANSLCRPALRASKRFATLAQAMRSTSPTRAIIIFSGWPKCARSTEEPCAARCRLIR